jgi:hypothetical protein
MEVRARARLARETLAAIEQRDTERAHLRSPLGIVRELSRRLGLVWVDYKRFGRRKPSPAALVEHRIERREAQANSRFINHANMLRPPTEIRQTQ